MNIPVSILGALIADVVTCQPEAMRAYFREECPYEQRASIMALAHRRNEHGLYHTRVEILRLTPEGIIEVRCHTPAGGEIYYKIWRDGFVSA